MQFGVLFWCNLYASFVQLAYNQGKQSFMAKALNRPEIYEYTGAAIAQGVQKVAEKLILSYTEIKMRAGELPDSGRQTGGGATGGKDTGDDGVREPGSESDWDLDLTLTTVKFNKAKLERIRLMGTRCVGCDCFP